MSNHRHAPILLHMRTLSIIVVLGFALTSCYWPIAQGDRSQPGGDYVVNGVDPDGNEYGGFLSIKLTETPNEFDMQWVVTGTVQEGHGVLDGTRLEVEWETLDEFEVTSSGTGTYELADDGVLRGTRTVDGSDGIGTEEAFPDL